MTLLEIEQLTKQHADARSELADLMNAMQCELDDVKDKYMPLLREKAAACAVTGGKLRTAIEDSKPLFEKPRTRIFHGIRVGYKKGKGKLVITNESKVIERIKTQYKDEIGVLIDVRETPNKNALQSLPVKDLKALGITVVDTDDQIVIRGSDSDIDKMANALLETDEADA